MRILILLSGFLTLCSVAGAQNLVCYYDSESYLREGLAKMQSNDLELALQFCTHLIYGYAGIRAVTNELVSLQVDLDMFHYRDITVLKTKYPGLKIFLSVGGDRDIDLENPMKYIQLLESGREGQQAFVDSSIELLKRNGFDGLDLAFQLPRNKARKVHGTLGKYWKKFKKIFTGDYVVDVQADEHKKQYTEFVENLKNSFAFRNLSLSMTVLPNVNSTWYFDVAEIAHNFEFINLAAFDFLTPERNPEEADYTAPIYALEDEHRVPHYNIESQVNYWLENNCPPKKINLGIASYGRAWKFTLDSGLSGVPIVFNTDGPAMPGIQSKKWGFLSWPEICAKLPTKINEHYRGEKAPLRKVSDLEQRYGNYAFRPADENGDHGMWVSYDDPDVAGIKATYAKNKKLGGVALFDLSYDDFRGLCTGQKFPMLRSIKYYS